MVHLDLAAAICLLASTPGGDPILVERFSGPLDSAWTVHASRDATVEVKDGALEIAAFENTFAHAARSLGADRVRASCSIRPGLGVSWATSLFLYWGPGDWVQASAIDRNGGCRYSCIMAEGAADESDLARCPFDRWQEVGIEVGDGVIRIASREDGGGWKVERSRPRPGSFRGPPALVIAGKGFGRGDGAYPRPHLDNDYGERGRPAVSRIRDLRIEALPDDRARATAEERRAWEAADRDVRGEEELSGGRDPTFESVARHFPPMKRPREAAGVKDGDGEIGIAPDGSLQLSEDPAAPGSPVAFFEAGDPPARFGSGGCEKDLNEGCLPIVRATWRRDGVTFRQLAFGWSEGMRPERELWAYAGLAAENDGATARVVDVAFRVEPGGRRIAWKLHIAPGASRSIGARIPFGRPGAEPEEVDPAALEERRREVAAAWSEVLDAGARFVAPEKRVNDARRAWIAWGFLDVDLQGGRLEPHDGSGFYEVVYGYSAALWPNALDLWGFHDDARRYLESLFSMQRADGLFTANFGTPDPGALLLAASEHGALTGDAEWIRSMARRMVRMCDWIIAKRKESMKLVDGKRPVTWGLILFSPYCDFQTPCHDYFGDAFCWAGLDAAGRALAWAGHADDGRRIAAEASAYRADILASMDAAIIERDGMRMLPMEPDTRRLLRDSRYRGGHYYGLVASCMLESGLLPPGDPRAALVTDLLEKRGGLILGMCEFDGGVDHAYSYGYWMDRLRSGRPEKAVLGLYGSLAYGMSRGTWAGVEVTRLVTGDNDPTLPHLYSTTQQLRLLRHMLLREDRDVLMIGEAIPRGWLEDGKEVRLDRAPTRFGPVSFAIRSEIGRGRIATRIELPGAPRSPLRALRLHLRAPERMRPASASVGGKTAMVSGETVTVDAPRGSIEVEARY